MTNYLYEASSLKQRHVRFGSDSDFVVLMTPTAKPGMPRNRTASGRRRKATYADAPCKQWRRTGPTDHSERQKTRVEPDEIKGNRSTRSPLGGLRTSGRIQTTLQVEERARDLRHAQSKHRQQAVRLACGQPEGRRCSFAWRDRRSRHGPREQNRTSRLIGMSEQW
jgi:hypothetical protein